MADQIPAWISEGALAVSCLVAVQSIFTYVNGHARRTRLLEHAKLRMDIWKAKLEISERTLTGVDLDAAKAKANAGSELVMKETNDRLLLMAEHNLSTVPQSVGWLRTRLLLFAPPRQGRTEGYFVRGFYYFSIILLVLTWIATINAKEHGRLYIGGYELLLRTGLYLYMSYVMWWVATRQKATKEPKLFPPKEI